MSCHYENCDLAFCSKPLCSHQPVCCSICKCINCICCPRCYSFPCICCPICLYPNCKCCKLCCSYPCECCVCCHLFPCGCAYKSPCKELTCRTIRCLSPLRIRYRPLYHSPFRIICKSPKRICLHFNYE